MTFTIQLAKIILMSKTKKFLTYLLLTVITLAVGYAGSSLTAPAISNWYLTLDKPFFNPPNWVFAPVWTSLYLLMAISAAQICTSPTANKLQTKAISLFFIQLGLNFSWSFIFFYLQNPLIAFGEIIILWLTILWMIMTFYKIDKTAAFLNLPYLAWVTFAGILNLSIVVLN